MQRIVDGISSDSGAVLSLYTRIGRTVQWGPSQPVVLNLAKNPSGAAPSSAMDSTACPGGINTEIGQKMAMRKIRYRVATSLDGFIAGPNGEADWIVPDPEIDFARIWAQFDTGLMGRRTYGAAVQRLGEEAFSGIDIIVFSRTMTPREHPRVTILPEFDDDWVRALKEKSGRDIWLFGGSQLFGAFLHAGCVDTVEVDVIPVLLGAGVPLLPPPYSPTKLRLVSQKIYRSGRVSLEYAVQH